MRNTCSTVLFQKASKNSPAKPHQINSRISPKRLSQKVSLPIHHIAPLQTTRCSDLAKDSQTSKTEGWDSIALSEMAFSKNRRCALPTYV